MVIATLTSLMEIHGDSRASFKKQSGVGLVSPSTFANRSNLICELELYFTSAMNTVAIQHPSTLLNSFHLV